MTFEVLTKIPSCLINSISEGDTVAPGFAELEELAEVDSISKRVLVVRDGNDIEACALCYVENRRHHGLQLKVYSLFGYLLHDYCRIFCKSAEAMDMLQNAAIKDARDHGCDIILWNNIPSELIPKNTLPTYTNIKLFMASKCEQGWSRFYRSKHVKYLLNRAKKINGDYRVEVIDGYVSDDLMNEFAKFHIYRWKFAGYGSPFDSNINRISEYRVHSENKHYLRILAGNELIACHYGMKYGDTLLFHTPVINPKYLDISPMKLILAETARYCENNGISSIDFGHGDEAYKDGYCTLPRYTCHYQKVLSWKGYLSIGIGKYSDSIIKPVCTFAKNAIKKFRLLCHDKTFAFRIKSNNNANQTDDGIFLCSNWIEFCEFSVTHNLPIYKWQFARFHQDKSSKFIAIATENEYKASAWLKAKDHSSENLNTNDLYLYDVIFTNISDLDVILCEAIGLSHNSLNIVGNKELYGYIKSSSDYTIESLHG